MNTYSIASVGDISFAGGFSQRADWEHWVGNDVRNLLKADIVIGNLECVLIPDECAGSISGSDLCLAASADKCIGALKNAGFNVLTLGNNHILDYEREHGLLFTKKYLTYAGIAFCGAGDNISEARRPAIIEVGQHRVGVLSRVYAQSFSDVTPVIAKDDKPGVAPLEIREVIAAARECRQKELCNFVILAVHWGIQEVHYYLPELNDIAGQLLKTGIDLILGNHAHIVQGVTKFGDKYCSWGQGNFYFHPIVHPADPSVILYGPESKKNRLSAIHKFCWEHGKWDAVTHPVIQSDNNCVCLVDHNETEKIRQNVYGKWSKLAPIRFNCNWRKKEFFNVFRSISGKEKISLIKAVLSPSRWLQLLHNLIIKPINR